MNLTGSHGYAQPVSLTHSAPPPHVDVTLSPSSGVPSFDAAFRVTTTLTTTPGVYTFAITGMDSATRTRTATVTLTVDAVAPTGTMTLISPTHGITGVAVRPLFTWHVVTGTRTYRVQVARDDGFASPVVDEALAGTSYPSSADLRTDTTYYWRVTAQNACGSITSTARVFTTINPVDVFYDAMEIGAGKWTTETVVSVVCSPA